MLVGFFQILPAIVLLILISVVLPVVFWKINRRFGWIWIVATMSILGMAYGYILTDYPWSGGEYVLANVIRIVVNRPGFAGGRLV